MSVIRPPQPSPLFPNAPPPPARAARSDFFRQVTEGVQPKAETVPAGETPATATVRARVAPDPDQPARPGSLLDIRI
jgi:hypothetical protein